MKSRRVQSPGSFLPIASLAVAGVILAAVAGLYLGWIPAGLAGKGDAGPKAPAGRGAKVALAKPGPPKASRRPPEEVIVHEEGDGESPSNPLASKGPAEVAGPGAPKSPERLEYEAKARDAADAPGAQAQLARWCDERHLADEAKAHWEAVLRLNPDHEAARKRLGYKRQGRRWLTDAMIADESEQAKADKVWMARLEVLHTRMHNKGVDAQAIREKAVADLAEVTDPRAAPMLWRVFAGHPPHHLMVAEQLARLESPRSSLMLAAVAAYSPEPKAQRAATEELKGRNPEEFAEPLIALFGPPLRYKVSDLPSAPGEPTMKALEIEDERCTRQFVYLAGSLPPSPSADAFGGCSEMLRWMNAGWTKEGRELARAMNQAEARMAKDAADRQLNGDIAAVKALNDRIARRNDRVHAILTEATKEDFGTERGPWSRWLAERQGKAYSPPKQAPKITLAQFVEPIYQPSFIQVPPVPS